MQFTYYFTTFEKSIYSWLIGGERDEIYGSRMYTSFRACVRLSVCVHLLCVCQGLTHDVIQMHAHAYEVVTAHVQFRKSKSSWIWLQLLVRVRALECTRLQPNQWKEIILL